MRKYVLAVLTVGVLACGPAAAQVGTAWVRRYDGPANRNAMACALAVDGSGNLHVTAGSARSGADREDDYATIKYVQSGSVAEDRTRPRAGRITPQAGIVRGILFLPSSRLSLLCSDATAARHSSCTRARTPSAAGSRQSAIGFRQVIVLH